MATSLAGSTDTIVALSTPRGRSAIAVVRLSGDDAFAIGRKAITPWPTVIRRVARCRIVDYRGMTIDDGLVTTFGHPESFTGEDVVEISTHGGHYIPARVIQALIRGGAREALPGEFTRRAVLAGKLDIPQAEAIGDLIDARSAAMHRAAIEQLDGGLSRRVADLRSRLLVLNSLIAYDIDFPEEDDGPISRERISTDVDQLVDALKSLLATVPAGEIIRDGATVVVAGEPNVGKSSLFNALLGQSRAIVTEFPGTTRDAVEGVIESENWPLRLIDTAGLRETSDVIERMGIEVSERYLKQAHVVLACGDNAASIERTLVALDGKTEASRVVVRTKADLSESHVDVADVEVSAEMGSGLSALLAAVDFQLTSVFGSAIADAPLLTRARHIHAITEAKDELSDFSRLWREEVLPAPVAAVHLRAATVALENLIGAVSTDDVLDRVFSSFCVGK